MLHAPRTDFIWSEDGVTPRQCFDVYESRRPRALSRSISGANSLVSPVNWKGI
jgi:hypothetical protein